MPSWASPATRATRGMPRWGRQVSAGPTSSRSRREHGKGPSIDGGLGIARKLCSGVSRWLRGQRWSPSGGPADRPPARTQAGERQVRPWGRREVPGWLRVRVVDDGSSLGAPGGQVAPARAQASGGTGGGTRMRPRGGRGARLRPGRCPWQRTRLSAWWQFPRSSRPAARPGPGTEPTPGRPGRVRVGSGSHDASSAR